MSRKRRPDARPRSARLYSRIDCFGGSRLFDARAFSSLPIVVRGRALKFALQGIELHLASELRPFGIGSCYRLIGETVRRRPCLAHEILCLRDVGPNFGVHHGVQRRAARLRLLRTNRRAIAETNPGKRRQRHRPRGKGEKPVAFHFNVPALELCFVASRHDPSLLCRNRDETLRGFAILEWAKAWKIQ